MKVQRDHIAEQILKVYPYRVDLENCDEEPLHHIQVIQSHTCLLAIAPETYVIDYVSDNSASLIGHPWEEVIGRPLAEVLGTDLVHQLDLGREQPDGLVTLNPLQIFCEIGGQTVLRNVIAHRNDTHLVLEVEPVTEHFRSSAFHHALGQAMQRIQGLNEYDSLFTETARIIHRITGYDRVMIYRFDEEYNGEVIAEALRPGIEPFLGLHYPHTDIPQQARDLYLRNRIRIISDVRSTPARLRNAADREGTPLDLSLADGRGVSPVHLEYLGNMGVASTLSLAIILEGKLWGLFALHHYSPRFLDYHVRSFLQFLGRIFGGHLAVQATGHSRARSNEQSTILSTLGEQMAASGDVLTGLTAGDSDLLKLFSGTTGVTARFGGEQRSLGSVPPDELMEKLVTKVRQLPDSKIYYSTHNLGKLLPALAPHRDVAAGGLLVFLDADRENWIFWFRPERIKDVRWGGKPAKELVESPDGTRRLSPRKSFSAYLERVSGYSTRWEPSDIDVALNLRTYVKDSILRNYGEVQQLNATLRDAYQELEAFSYTVSHDLRAPLRAIDGYSQILQEDYGHLLGEDGQDLIRGIRAGSDRMRTFIDDILTLSMVGRAAINPVPVSLSPLIQDVIQEALPAFGRGEAIQLTVDEDLPPIQADARMLRQVYANLLSNAVKYVKPATDGQRWIRVGYEFDPEVNRDVYTVANSGPTIPPEHRKSIFEMFSRLTDNEHLDGTGVGLAIVQRIVHRHGGEVWVSNRADEGVHFHFYFSAP